MSDDEKLYTKADMARAVQARVRQVKTPHALVDLVVTAMERIDALEKRINALEQNR
jgi:hypothetical protein